MAAALVTVAPRRCQQRAQFLGTSGGGHRHPKSGERCPIGLTHVSMCSQVMFPSDYFAIARTCRGCEHGNFVVVQPEPKSAPVWGGERRRRPPHVHDPGHSAGEHIERQEDPERRGRECARRYDCRSARLMPTPPSAPIAPANPISAPDIARDHCRALGLGHSSERLRASKIDGIILYTEPLPMPDSRNSAMKPIDVADHRRGRRGPGRVVVQRARADQHPGGQDHPAEHRQRHPATADAVGQLAAVHPRQGAEQRADERDLGGMQRRLRGALPAGGEVDLQHLAEREREADERAERADVEQRDHPGVAFSQNRAHGASGRSCAARGCPCTARRRCRRRPARTR